MKNPIASAIHALLSVFGIGLEDGDFWRSSSRKRTPHPLDLRHTERRLSRPPVDGARLVAYRRAKDRGLKVTAKGWRTVLTPDGPVVCRGESRRVLERQLRRAARSAAA